MWISVSYQYNTLVKTAGDDIDKRPGPVIYMKQYRLSRRGVIPEPGPRAVDFHPQDSSYEKQLPTCGFLHDAAA
jgi:hypothetical protein